MRLPCSFSRQVVGWTGAHRSDPRRRALTGAGFGEYGRRCRQQRGDARLLAPWSSKPSSPAVATPPGDFQQEEPGWNFSAPVAPEASCARRRSANTPGQSPPATAPNRSPVLLRHVPHPRPSVDLGESLLRAITGRCVAEHQTGGGDRSEARSTAPLQSWPRFIHACNLS